MTKPEGHASPAPVDRVRASIVVAIAIVTFAAALALRSRLDPWTTTAGAAVLAIGMAVWTLGRARLVALLTTTVTSAALAIGGGLLLVVATHVVYDAFELAHQDVDRLYANVAGQHPQWLLAIITGIVVVSEELVWRGVAFELLKPRRRHVAHVLALLLYVVPQLLGGTWILIVAAAGLGAVFTWQRIVTRGLISPILTHAVWSIAIFVVVPLEVRS
jgi:membrane protease YdiL (CAAX protease family)